MRLMSIASGSDGNCIYVGSDNTHILIDDGISKKRVVEALNKIQLDLNDLNGIFITHEHSDHISGLNVLLKKNNIDVYGSKGTIEAILANDKFNDIDKSLFHIVNADNNYMLNDLIVHPFNVSHDASMPYAYTVSNNNKKVAVATDMGYYDDYIVENLKNVNGLLLEANHDVRMLEAGPYPYYLKQRIIGNKGHLSNESSGRLLNDILHDNMEHVFLGHLSHHNNMPLLAYETVKVEINLGPNSYKAEDFDIKVANRKDVSELVTI